MTGTKIDGLVILLSGKPHIEKDKLLGVPVILSSTGVLQCEAIIQVLKDWEVTDVIIGMVFDTTRMEMVSGKIVPDPICFR